jgi:hypothetical protein
MHIVTYSSFFSNIKDAMTNTRGLAVVGVFFEVKFFFFNIIFQNIFLLIIRLAKNQMNFLNQ